MDIRRINMIQDWYYEELKYDIGIDRLKHSLRVMDVSIELAIRYNSSIEKASLAGLLHDCGKLQGGINLLKIADEFGIILDSVTRNNKELIHSYLGAVLASRKYKVNDEEVLNAIRYHTTGRENMSLLEKIVYIADLIEPGRDFEGVEKIRDLAYKDIDECLLYAIDHTLKYVLDKGKLIHLDSVKARNQLLIQKNME